MKTLHLIIAIVLASALANKVLAITNDSTQVDKKIVKKIIVSDEEGEITTDSTFIYEGDHVKVIVKTSADSESGDKTIHKFIQHSNGKSMAWTDTDDLTFDINVETDGDSSKVFIIKRKEGMPDQFHINNGLKHMPNMMMLTDETFKLPNPSFTHMNSAQSNQIDLNSPDIVSFERETLKNGNEKITIIRKKDE